jgi:hypothetical protein
MKQGLQWFGVLYDAVRLLAESSKAAWDINPIVFTNQFQEDSIGRSKICMVLALSEACDVTRQHVSQLRNTNLKLVTVGTCWVSGCGSMVQSTTNDVQRENLTSLIK